MLHLYDQLTTTRILTLGLDPKLSALIVERISNLTSSENDLSTETEFLVVENGDTELDVIACVGFTPLIEPIDGIRFPNADFHPFWDWLVRHDGWYEMIITFGSTYSLVLLIQSSNNNWSILTQMCEYFSSR